MTAGAPDDDQKIDKQMGCMAGFLQIFDRHQLLTGKRLHSTKRLPPSPAADLTSSSSSEESPVVQTSSECAKSPTNTDVSPSIPIPPCELKEGMKSTWKFREYPRLSLDSRVVVDAKGSVYPREIRTRTNAAFISATGSNAEEDENERQRRSPSVVARLMGLEMLPESTREPLQKPELRRSSSESRSRDLPNRVVESQKTENNREVSVSPWKPLQQQRQQRKNFFDTQDFFPEPKQKESIYGELEKRLKIRGITEPAEDLETLKQILEALQLKGLLHSNKRLQRIGNRNFVFDSKRFNPIVVMKPSNSPRKIFNESPPSNLKSKTGIRRNVNTSETTMLPVKHRTQNERRFSHSMSPDRSEGNARSPCSPARRKLPGVETQRKGTQSKSSPSNSPKMTPPRRKGSEQVSKSPRNIRKSTSPTTDDETSSISSCISSISHKSQLKEENNLLARCDKLLNSIAEISTTTESQPSPVSVLDSSFYQEDVSPLKRCIDFKEVEEDNWSPIITPIQVLSNDTDFVYVTEIFEASKYISEASDLFLLLEKQIYKSESCNASRLHRRLVFETVAEILHGKKDLPPSRCILVKPSFEEIWLEFSRMRERSNAEDLFEDITGVLQKDLANDGWGDNPVEKSEMVLDIERLIFKDLIGDTIQYLVQLAPKKLVF